MTVKNGGKVTCALAKQNDHYRLLPQEVLHARYQQSCNSAMSTQLVYPPRRSGFTQSDAW
jgi:hypothetical protein